VVFDKTGTITYGKPAVTDVVAFGENLLPSTKSKDIGKILEIAATVEKNSEHPLAKSIVQHASDLGTNIGTVQDFVAVPGMGVKAVYDGKNILVGSPRFGMDEKIRMEHGKQELMVLQEQGKTTMIVSLDGILIGLVGLLDLPKPNARSAVSYLKKMGIKTVMLTGDNEPTAKFIAQSVGVDRVFANVLPSGKSDVIQMLQREGPVTMVGDGINDAPALTEADVGIAIGSGTDIALESGNVILIRDDIMDVVSAIETSKKTVSKIKQNLFYAFAYNVVLIPVAALGLLYPALAGLAMAASSVSVTSSSLLLKRWSPPSKKKK
jgi:Cu+-exporting ATPase